MMHLRNDLQLVAAQIPQGATVLDVGCGEGELLAYLAEVKAAGCRGIELSQLGVNACITRGLMVIQGDADIDLDIYPNKAVDYVILSQTLQTLKDPAHVLAQLARIGRQVVISVPNFGHWRNRLYLLLHGKMPVTKALTYAWYDTPNIHFCTLKDFLQLADTLQLRVQRKAYGVPGWWPQRLQQCDALANWFAVQGVFVISDNRVDDEG